MYYDQDPKTGRDLWLFPIGEPGGPNRKPTLFLRTPFQEAQGQISPDGHWIAYRSNLSGAGTSEVYVQPFPSGEGLSRISKAGAGWPRWRADGKELFYVAANGKMMAVPVTASAAGSKPSFESGTPQALFDSHMLQWTPIYQYDVTSDGKRFLVVTTPDTDAKGPRPLTVVTNWLDGLKK